MDRPEEKYTDNEDNEFYFESDHLALKGNKDYMSLLKSIVVLQAQRTQAIADLDKLMDSRAKATKDPISFVAQLQNSDLPELPGPQKVAEIPYIDWAQYNIVSDLRMRPQTRHGNILPQIQTKAEIEDGKVILHAATSILSSPFFHLTFSWIQSWKFVWNLMKYEYYVNTI